MVTLAELCSCTGLLHEILDSDLTGVQNYLSQPVTFLGGERG